MAAQWKGMARRVNKTQEAEFEQSTKKEEIMMPKPQRGIFEKMPGSNVWWIRFVDCDGKYRREKIGSKSAAIKVYQKRKTEAVEGIKLPSLRRRKIMFSELADFAITYIEAKYSRPMDDVRRATAVKTWFEGRPADSITPDEIREKLKTVSVAKKWSASTTNHHHNVISLCYRLGLEKEKVKESPIHRKVRKLKENNNRVRFLTPDEERRLREAIRSKPEWAEHEPELDLALHTGLRRRSMYIDLVWENIDLKSRIAIIPETKNEDQVVVPLNDVAMGALAVFQSRGDGSGRVVRNAAGRTLTVNPHWFLPALQQAGIKNFRWHDCRHTYASRLRQTGTPLGNIAELLGHRGLAMTKRYAHLSISNLHEAVSRISNSTPIAPDQISDPKANSYVN
jgi:integrase